MATSWSHILERVRQFVYRYQYYYVRLSAVCLSGALRYCIKTTKRIVEILLLPYSPVSLVVKVGNSVCIL